MRVLAPATPSEDAAEVRGFRAGMAAAEARLREVAALAADRQEAVLAGRPSDALPGDRRRRLGMNDAESAAALLLAADLVADWSRRMAALHAVTIPAGSSPERFPA